MIKTVVVPSEDVCSVMSIGIDLKFEAICPVPGKPYGGTIEVSYKPMIEIEEETKLIEWNSLQDWIESLRDTEHTAEGMANLVAQRVHDAVNPEWVKVTLRVESAFHLPVMVVAEL